MKASTRNSRTFTFVMRISVSAKPIMKDASQLVTESRSVIASPIRSAAPYSFNNDMVFPH
ncbi:hypothetical protein D9M69_656060 [compost metagenome]